MLRILMPIALTILFAGWVCYRLFVKKDLNKQMNSLYLGLFFVAVWGMLYWFLQ